MLLFNYEWVEVSEETYRAVESELGDCGYLVKHTNTDTVDRYGPWSNGMTHIALRQDECFGGFGIGVVSKDQKG